MAMLYRYHWVKGFLIKEFDLGKSSKKNCDETVRLTDWVDVGSFWVCLSMLINDIAMQNFASLFKYLFL